MKQRKYEAPAFVGAEQQGYERWLNGRAIAHVKRDRKRGNQTAKCEEYKVSIHGAVVASKGRDFYTGEQLDWSLIGTYANENSKSDGRRYKASFALMPTVDHVSDGLGPADFVICSWRTNDAKNDLTLAQFVELCQRVVQHQGGAHGADS